MSLQSVTEKTLTTNPQPFKVEGKTAIVTGAGSGINLSFAELLLSRNCNVLFADIALRPEAQKVVDAYSKKTEGQPRAVFQQTDVRDWSQLTRMMTVARSEFNTIDIVCPGAGIYDPHWSNFWHPPGSPESKDSPTGNSYATLDINLTHPIRVTQLAISEFLNPSNPAHKASPSNPKRVVLISSIAGQCPNLPTPIYVAAKHGLNGFIRSLGALDAEFGIRVNGVAPGIIKTPLWTEHPEKLKFLDEGRDEWVGPEEVAGAMVRCLEDMELGGGTVLEVGKGQTREVGVFMDPGPKGSGLTASRLVENYGEVFGLLGAEGWGK
jgi:NAD(P)-dependent dehydrogenase (short-subunit alcohol dehydrogenase family)